jgi:TP901 family phage tail tape measure protein
MADQSLGLGVIFKGLVDNTFRNAVDSLKKALGGLNGALIALSQKTTTLKTSMKEAEGVTSSWANKLGNASTEVSKYRRALYDLTEQHQDSDIAFRTLKGSLDKVERGIYLTAKAMGLSGKELDSFVVNADRVGMVNQMLEGKIKVTSRGIQGMITPIKQVTKTQDEMVNGVRVGSHSLSTYDQALNKLSNRGAKFTESLTEAANRVGFFGNAFVSAKNSLVAADNLILKTGASMNALGKNGDAFIRTADRTAVATKLMAGELNISNGVIKKHQKELIDTEQSATLFERGMLRLGKSLRTIASYGAAAYVIYGLTTALREGAQAIIDYDQALKDLQAITNATDSETALMGEKIKEVARNTKFSTKEIAEGMTIIGQAGFTAKESIDAIEASSLLATGTMSKLEQTTDLLTTTIRAFGKQASDAGNIADMMSAAINYSKLDVEKLRTAFNYIGPASNDVGVSLEDVTASMMLLANAGVRASTIGTGLRQVFARLVAPTSGMASQMQKAGLSVRELNPLYTNFENVVGNLSKVLTDGSKAFQMFGLRGASTALILASMGKEGFVAVREQLMQTGLAMDMAQKQMEGLGLKIKNLKDRLELLAVSLGEGGVGSAFKAFVDILRYVTNALITFAETDLGKAVTAFVTAATVLGGIGLVIRVIASAFTYAYGPMMAYVTGLIGVTTASTAMGAATAGATGAITILGRVIAAHPIGAFVTVIGVAVSGLYAYMKATKDVTLEEDKKATTLRDSINKLDMYADRLDKVNDGSIEQKRLVADLTRAFPQLAAAMNQAGQSAEQQARALRNLSNAQREAYANVMARAIQERVKQVEDAKKKIDTLNEQMMKVGTASPGKYPWEGGEQLEKEQRDELITGMSLEVIQLQTQIEKTKNELVGLAVEYEKTTGQVASISESVVPRSAVEAVTRLQQLGSKFKDLFDSMEHLTDDEKIKRQTEVFKLMGDQVAKYFEGANDDVKAQMVLIAKTLHEQEGKLAKDVETQAMTHKEAIAQRERLSNEAVKKILAIQDKESEELISRKELQLEEELNAINTAENEKQLTETQAREKRKAAELKYGNEILNIRREMQERAKKFLGDNDPGTVEYNRKVASAVKELNSALKRDTSGDRKDENEFGRFEDKRLKHLEESLQKQQLLVENSVEFEKMTVIEGERAKLDIEERSLRDRLSIAQQALKEAKSLKGQESGEYEKYAAKVEDIEGKIIQTATKRHQLERNLTKQTLDAKISDLKASADYQIAIIDQISLGEQEAAYQKYLIKKDMLNQELKLQQQITQQIKNIHGEGSPELMKAKQDELRIYTEIAQAITAEERRQIQYRMEYNDRYYKLGKISVQQYLNDVRAAYNQGLIDIEEYNRRRVMLEGGFWDRVKLGIDDAKANIQSWGEFTVSTTTNAVERMADGSVEAFGSWIDGSKSAKEAAADFFGDLASWISKTIAKMIMLKALTNLFSTMGFGSLFSGASASVAHTGGVVGRLSSKRTVDPSVFLGAKRYHSGGVVGLSKGEIPIIAREKETIRTPEQEAALQDSLSRGGVMGVEIHIHNEKGDKMGIQSAQGSMDMGRIILDVVLDGVTRDHTYRMNMKSALAR